MCGKQSKQFFRQWPGEILMSRCTIFVAAHKKPDYTLPRPYRICQVNAEKNGRWDGDYVHDNDGEKNISDKNDRYSELTALYELWKNCDDSIKGLVHYRRFFSRDNSLTPVHFMNHFLHPSYAENLILTELDFQEYLSGADIILQYPVFPSLVSAREDLLRFVFPHDVLILDHVIYHDFPDYADSYEKVMLSTNISYLNMFVARSEICDSYCEWLFQVLEKVEAELQSLEQYDAQHRRIFGYLSEVLLNVWVLHQHMRVQYAFVLQLETEKPLSKKSSFQQRVKAKLSDRPVKSAVNMLFYSVPCRYRQLEKAAKNPYMLNLRTLYSKIGSLQDLSLYYRRYTNTRISTETVSVSGTPVQYHLVLQDPEQVYAYRQSNNRCIVSIPADDPHVFLPAREEILSRYQAEYTVTFRLLTRNPDLVAIGRELPDVQAFVLNKTLRYTTGH